MRCADAFATAGRAQRGSVMIEALVSIVVTSLALLASAALSINAAKVNQSGRLRAQAVVLVNDIAERIDANIAAANLGNFALASGVTPTAGPDCAAVDCTQAQHAQAALANWHGQVLAALPQATTELVYTAAAGAAPARYAITVRWIERSLGHGGAARTNAGAVTDSEAFAYTATKAVPPR